MTAARPERQTYLPDEAHRDVLARIDAELATPAGTGEAPLYLLFGPGSNERIEVPDEVYRVLRHVIDAMSHGLAVTVAPQTMTLTTQQAADLIGVSRPTFIRYLDAGQIPFERPGGHRRVRLSDVLAFRDRRREAQYAAIEATHVDVADEDDVASVLEVLRATRQRHTAARRSVPQG